MEDHVRRVESVGKFFTTKLPWDLANTFETFTHCHCSNETAVTSFHIPSSLLFEVTWSMRLTIFRWTYHTSETQRHCLLCEQECCSVMTHRLFCLARYSFNLKFALMWLWHVYAFICGIYGLAPPLSGINAPRNLW